MFKMLHPGLANGLETQPLAASAGHNEDQFAASHAEVAQEQLSHYVTDQPYHYQSLDEEDELELSKFLF